MLDVQSLVNDFLNKLRKRNIEGSQATAKQTAELLRLVISHHRVPYNNQAGALIDAVRAVGEQLIAANPVGMNLSSVSDDDDDGEQDNHPVLSAVAVAAAARSALRPPSLQTLLEDMPDSAVVAQTSSSGGDSEGKSKSADKSSRTQKLKHDVIEAVNELIQDITTPLVMSRLQSK